MKPGRLSLAAYSHFGGRGLKGIEMYYLVKEVWKRHALEQVIAVSRKHCRYDFDLGLVQTLPGQSKVISGLMEIKKRVWKEFPSDWLGEVIFDRYAASQLREGGSLLMLTAGLIDTARRGKILGYETCLYGATPDPRYLAEQTVAEQEVFGLKTIKSNRSRARRMARFTAHVAASDYILALSEFAKATYVKYGFPEERIFVAPLGIDLKRFEATPPPSGEGITYLLVAHVNGTTGVLKGMQYLLRAWSELKLKNARLRVCGDMGAEAQDLLKRYRGRLENVEFTGRVSNPEAYYQKSSVFVLPSLAEGLPKAVLEAMACARPVITTPLLRPVIREGLDGFYVPMRDVDALKEKMLYFYNHPEEVARMGKHASERARSFTWEQFSQRTAEILWPRLHQYRNNGDGARKDAQNG